MKKYSERELALIADIRTLVEGKSFTEAAEVVVRWQMKFNEERAYWETEAEKCKESPAYFFNKYITVNDEKPNPVTDDDFKITIRKVRVPFEKLEIENNE